MMALVRRRSPDALRRDHHACVQFELRRNACAADAGLATADPETVAALACAHRPFAVGERQVTRRKTEADRARLARSERDSLEALERAQRHPAARPGRDVQLDDLVSAAPTDVGEDRKSTRL